MTQMDRSQLRTVIDVIRNNLTEGSNTEAVVSDALQAIADSSLNIFESAPTAQTPLEIGAKYWWKADMGITETASRVSQKLPKGFAGWTITELTAVENQPDSKGGTSATLILETVANDYHTLVYGVTGTPSATTSIAFEWIIKPVGGAYLWFLDPYDAAPLVKLFGGQVTIAAGANTTAEAVDLGDGWYKVTIASRLWHLDGSYGGQIASGTSSNWTQHAGTVTVGALLEQCRCIQFEEPTEVLSQGTASAALASDSTYHAERIPKNVARGPAFWSPPGATGWLKTTEAAALAMYLHGLSHTTIFTMHTRIVPSAAIAIFSTRLDGLAFTIGISAVMRIWAGIYGGVTLLTPDALQIDRKYCIAVTCEAGLATIFIDGVAVTGQYEVGIGTSASDALLLQTQSDLAIEQLACFDRILSSREILAISLGMLGESKPPVTPDVYELHNSILHDSHPLQHCPLAEARFTLDGTATSVTVDSYMEFAGYGGDFWGPAVIADGVAIDEMAVPNVVGKLSQTFALPAGTTSLVVRDGTGGASWACSRASAVRVVGAKQVIPAVPDDRYVVYGDSVSVGQLTTKPALLGWTALLRDSLAEGSELTVYGTGGAALWLDGSTSDLRTAIAARLVTILDGTESNTFICAIGINDGTGYFASWGSAANFGTAYADLLDKIHTAKPSARIVAVAMHTCTGAYASTIDQVRAQIVAVQTARSEWSELVNLSLLTVTMVDDLHPDDDGHATIEAAIAAQLAA